MEVVEHQISLDSNSGLWSKTIKAIAKYKRPLGDIITDTFMLNYIGTKVTNQNRRDMTRSTSWSRILQYYQRYVEACIKHYRSLPPDTNAVAYYLAPLVLRKRMIAYRMVNHVVTHRRQYDRMISTPKDKKITELYKPTLAEIDSLADAINLERNVALSLTRNPSFLAELNHELKRRNNKEPREISEQLVDTWEILEVRQRGRKSLQYDESPPPASQKRRLVEVYSDDEKCLPSPIDNDNVVCLQSVGEQTQDYVPTSTPCLIQVNDNTSNTPTSHPNSEFYGSLGAQSSSNEDDDILLKFGLKEITPEARRAIKAIDITIIPFPKNITVLLKDFNPYFAISSHERSLANAISNLEVGILSENIEKSAASDLYKIHLKTTETSYRQILLFILSMIYECNTTTPIISHRRLLLLCMAILIVVLVENVTVKKDSYFPNLDILCYEHGLKLIDSKVIIFGDEKVRSILENRPAPSQETVQGSDMLSSTQSVSSDSETESDISVIE